FALGDHFHQTIWEPFSSTPMIQSAALLPIAPILLLPFIIVFFVAVFPLWIVGVAVMWIVKSIVRLAAGKNSRATALMQRGFRWVLTFGGFTETFAARDDQAKAPRV